MSVAEALQILEEEDLRRYNWFSEHEIRPNEVLIDWEEGHWVVCAADERACVPASSRRLFDREEEALDCFIRLVRLEKNIT